MITLSHVNQAGGRDMTLSARVRASRQRDPLKVARASQFRGAMHNNRLPSPSTAPLHQRAAASRKVRSTTTRPGAAAAGAATAASSAPFAAFAPAPGGAFESGAETKLYKVPRELIQLAKAEKSKRGAGGTLTPLAPKPGAELEATLREYTASMSSGSAQPPAPLELELPPATASAPPDGSAPAAPFELLASPSRRMPAPRSSFRRREITLAEASDSRARQPWVFYAGLSLVVAYCVHILLAL